MKPLARHLEEKGMTLDQLVEAAELDAKLVQAIVSGNYTPSPSERKRLADVLGVSIDDVSWGRCVPVELMVGPAGRCLGGEGAKIFPEFIERLLGEYKIRDKKFHIAGMSNGGRSAFHIAAMYPQYFVSVTGFPGYLPDATPERVAALSKMCIFMHVGELDGEWLTQMQDQ